MSKVVHPYALRLPLIRGWRSRWFKSGSAYRTTLVADTKIREYLEKKLKTASVGAVDIERGPGITRILIHTARPGIIIGRSGEGANALRADLLKFFKKNNLETPADLKIDVIEITNPDADAKIIALSIAEMLEKRMTFRRVLKMTTEKVMQARGVKGVKITLSGRLGGADMARKESLKLGGIPLQFMRGDVDYATHAARMTYGAIGIKVWIYRGDSLTQK